MTQTNVRAVSLRTILRSDDFRAGVADARAGRPARFDEFPGWFYEWGRQFAFILPMQIALTSRKALNYLARAFARGDLTAEGSE